jgi:hypothetical protein
VVCGTLPSEVATKASRAWYSAAVTPLVMGTLFLVARSKVTLTQGTPRGPAMERAAAHARSPGVGSRRTHPRLGAGHGFGAPEDLPSLRGAGEAKPLPASGFHGGASRAPGGFRDHRDTIWSPSVAGAPHPDSWQM